MTNITFKIINHDSPEYEEAVKLRERILREPLGLTFLREELEAEKNHVQIAGFQGNSVISTAVLVPEGQSYKMQRVVVKQDLQDSGIGSKMMKFCESYARSKGFRSIYCHARDSAVDFYLKNHYVAEGNYFDEDTIPHLKMRKML
jgi:predicted GNAT family N-acyltransferase